MNRQAFLSLVKYAILIFLVSLALSACSEKKSLEDEIRQFVSSAVTAAESREALTIRKLVSEGYMDQSGRDQRALTALAMGYFLRHKNIHLFTQISEIKFPQPEKSSVKLYVAMTGSPVKGAQALLDIRADLYQFDLILKKESGDWLLQKARWQRASVDEILGGK